MIFRTTLCTILLLCIALADPALAAAEPAPYSNIHFQKNSATGVTLATVTPEGYWDCEITTSATGGKAVCVPALRGSATCLMVGIVVTALGETGPLGGHSACGDLRADCGENVAGSRVVSDLASGTEIRMPATSCQGFDLNAGLEYVTPWTCEVTWQTYSVDPIGDCYLNDP